MAHPFAATAALAALALTVAASPPSPPTGNEGAASTSASPDASPPGAESSGTSSPDSDSASGGSSDPSTGDPGVLPADVAKTIPGTPPTIPGEVPANASIDQLVAASRHFLGPSIDMAAPFAGLIDIPEGIPTPAGSTVTEMLLSLDPEDDPSDSHYYGSVHFESTATAADIAEYYETLLPAAGYPQSGDSTSSDQYGRERTLEFDNPDASYSLADITVTLTESVTDEDAVPTHELQWYADVDQSDLAPFLGWAPGLPLPADAEPVEVLLATSNFLDVNSMSIEVVYEMPAGDPTTMHATFESQLPVAGYAINSEDDTDTSSELTGPGLPQLSIYWNEGYPEGVRATVRGRIVL